MGTNYYIKGYSENDNMNPNWHIGKRSAAGHFCFDCDTTLCVDGPERVHYCRTGNRDTQWHTSCPMCGKMPNQENMAQSSGGLELGFNKNPYVKKTGVASASSFSFAMSLRDLKRALKHDFGKLSKAIVVDEYDREYSYKEFIDMLNTIPKCLQYDCIGEEFC